MQPFHGNTPSGDMRPLPPQQYPQMGGSQVGGPAPVGASYPQASLSQLQSHGARPASGSSSRWIWWVLALLALGAGAGAVLAIVMRS
jgi:hypothetical protein